MTYNGRADSAPSDCTRALVSASNGTQWSPYQCLRYARSTLADRPRLFHLHVRGSPGWYWPLSMRGTSTMGHWTLRCGPRMGGGGRSLLRSVT